MTEPRIGDSVRRLADDEARQGTFKGKTAEWWSEACDTQTRRAEAAEARVRLYEARLNGVYEHVTERQEAARTSLSRMHGGHPFPAMLDAEAILPLVDPENR